MKKVLLAMCTIVLLAACGSNSVNDTNLEENESENNTEQNDNENNAESNTTENNETEAPETDENNQTDNTASNENEEEETTTPKVTDPDDLADLVFDIFKAQNEEDYVFLDSILSSGVKLDKETNTFYFDNVTYPHEQAFITEENRGELEHRFTNDEADDHVIVGFAAIDYENESSFVIEFEFIMEDGSFKMNDMDINK